MNLLENYKKLSKEDKGHLTMYQIYNSIYDTSIEFDYEISDDIVKDIGELSYDLYLEDDMYKLSSSDIAKFITEEYIEDNDFLDKIEDISYDKILEAIDNYNKDFYKNNEMER